MTPRIKGYRDLTDDEVAMINLIKDREIEVAHLWQRVAKVDVDQPDVRPFDVDQRWLHIARTHLEEGFMALCRAVAKPEMRF